MISCVWIPSGADDIMDRVLTVASLAVRPAMTEAAAPGLPNPSGANTGAMKLPRRHRMLSSKSEVMCRPGIEILQVPYDDRGHEYHRKGFLHESTCVRQYG